MGSGDIVVGKATFRSDQLTPQDQTRDGDVPRPSGPRQQQMCGAMTQQGDHNRAPSQPQEFVRLVGCRDPGIRPKRAPS
jgi:hypothetical protein